LSRASQAAGVSLMARCPSLGLPIAHAGTRAGAQPGGHAEARRQASGEPGCRENAGNAQAGSGEPSACLGNRRPTASRYIGRLRLGTGGQAFPAKAMHCGRLATSWSCPSFASPSWPPPRVPALAIGGSAAPRTPWAPGRLARTCLSGRPRRSRSGRVPALPARAQREVLSGLSLRFHRVARRTSLPSAPEDTSSSPGQIAGQNAGGRAPRASDDRGGLWEPAIARRWGWCRGLPDGQAPQRGRHDGYRREPWFCYLPARRTQRRLPLWAGTRQADGQAAPHGTPPAHRPDVKRAVGAGPSVPRCHVRHSDQACPSHGPVPVGLQCSGGLGGRLPGDVQPPRRK
jgi:hypothetical protein